MIDIQSPSVAERTPPTTAAEQSQPISEAKLEANRRNAKLSTGPSAAGIAASCQNHTIHGLARHSNGTFKLLTSEDPLGFEALKDSLATEHSPVTPTELILVNSMAESHWLSQRAQHLQDTLSTPTPAKSRTKRKHPYISVTKPPIPAPFTNL